MGICWTHFKEVQQEYSLGLPPKFYLSGGTRMHNNSHAYMYMYPFLSVRTLKDIFDQELKILPQRDFDLLVPKEISGNRNDDVEKTKYQSGEQE